MILSGVTKDDLRLLAQLVNTVQVGEYTCNGKDLCAAADAIRFLQETAVKASKSYTEAIAVTPDSPSVTAASAPVAAVTPVSPMAQPEISMPGMGDVKIKAFSPGKPSKK